MRSFSENLESIQNVYRAGVIPTVEWAHVNNSIDDYRGLVFSAPTPEIGARLSDLVVKMASFAREASIGMSPPMREADCEIGLEAPDETISSLVVDMKRQGL